MEKGKRKFSEYISLGFIYFSAAGTIIILFFILGYIIYRGLFFNNRYEYEVSSAVLQEIDGLILIAHKKNNIKEIPYETIRNIYGGKVSNWKKINGSTDELFPCVSARAAEKIPDLFGKKGLLIEVFPSSAGALQFTAENRGALCLLDADEYKTALSALPLKERGDLKKLGLRTQALLCNAGISALYGNFQLGAIPEKETVKLLNGTYTNWKDVGGIDLPIIPVFLNTAKDEQSAKEDFLARLSSTPGSFGLAPAWWQYDAKAENVSLIRISRQEWGRNLKLSYLFEPAIEGGRYGGISTVILNTFFMILLTLILSVPPGVFGAIYLVEYGKDGHLMEILRLGTETLAGIPSIIFGLFGMLVFVQGLGWGISLLSGCFTLMLMILPTIVRTSEEALKAVSPSLKEGSLALGATKIQTIFRVVLPAALSSIGSGLILAIGRALGETAALIYTMGSNYNLTSGLFDSTRTLSVHLYLLIAEGISSDKAFASGTVLIVFILAINTLSKGLVKRLGGK